MLETFRALNELADFQNIVSDNDSNQAVPTEEEKMPEVKVNPNLQLNIQIHIDPDTPDEKIETIFKNLANIYWKNPRFNTKSPYCDY
jgi:hypothetical protein